MDVNSGCGIEVGMAGGLALGVGIMWVWQIIVAPSVGMSKVGVAIGMALGVDMSGVGVAVSVALGVDMTEVGVVVSRVCVGNSFSTSSCSFL